MCYLNAVNYPVMSRLVKYLLLVCLTSLNVEFLLKRVVQINESYENNFEINHVSISVCRLVIGSILIMFFKYL